MQGRRVTQSKKETAVQAINETLPNPNRGERQESSTDDNSGPRKITEIYDMVKSLLNQHKHGISAIVGQEMVERGES